VSHNNYHAAIAGYVAGLSGTVVGYPLDSAKVWLQTGGCKNKHMALATATTTNGGTNSSSSMMMMTMHHPGVHQQQQQQQRRRLPAVATKTYQTLRALYSGVSGPLVTVGIVQSINFAIYDTSRKTFFEWEQQRQQQHNQYAYNKNDDNDNNKISYCRKDYLTQDSLIRGVATAGLLSGFVTAVATAPLVMIKTNQQITGNTFRRSVHETLFVRGRFTFQRCRAGFAPHLVGESVGRSIYYTSYEALKRSWTEHNRSCESLTIQERMVCAATSGILCWAIIFPFDSVRSRTYAAAAAVSATTTTTTTTTAATDRPSSVLLDTIRTMRRERSFYRGFWVTVFRAGPVAAAVLPVYDLTLERLSTMN
jgi:hypothetical protein